MILQVQEISGGPILPADKNPAGVLLPFMKQIVDLPGDVILTYNAGDVSLED